MKNKKNSKIYIQIFVVYIKNTYHIGYFGNSKIKLFTNLKLIIKYRKLNIFLYYLIILIYNLLI